MWQCDTLFEIAHISVGFYFKRTVIEFPFTSLLDVIKGLCSLISQFPDPFTMADQIKLLSSNRLQKTNVFQVVDILRTASQTTALFHTPTTDISPHDRNRRQLGYEMCPGIIG